jgi:hypothetical protein
MMPTLFEVGDIVRTFVQVDELHRVSIIDRKQQLEFVTTWFKRLFSSPTGVDPNRSQSSTKTSELERDRLPCRTIPS